VTDVLAAHPGWHYIGRDLSDDTATRHVIECSGWQCRERLTTPTYGQQGDAHRAHVAAALAEAGIGPVAEARREGAQAVVEVLHAEVRFPDFDIDRLRAAAEQIGGA
jgi:hypothetical protein